jgi:hypothetical protein
MKTSTNGVNDTHEKSLTETICHGTKAYYGIRILTAEHEKYIKSFLVKTLHNFLLWFSIFDIFCLMNVCFLYLYVFQSK